MLYSFIQNWICDLIFKFKSVVCKHIISTQSFFFYILFLFLFLCFHILRYIYHFNSSLNLCELTNLHHTKIVNLRNVWGIAFYCNKLWIHALTVDENCCSPEEKAQKVINNSTKRHRVTHSWLEQSLPTPWRRLYIRIFYYWRDVYILN